MQSGQYFFEKKKFAKLTQYDVEKHLFSHYTSVTEESDLFFSKCSSADFVQFMNNSQLQLLALLSLSRFFCDQFRTRLSLNKRDY